MKRRTWIIGAVVIVVLALAAYWAWRQFTPQSTAARPQTARVTRGNLVATVNAAGNVSATEEATMAFQTSGRIAAVHVQVGDVVKKGQVLMELDATDLQLALKNAQTNLASAQANYDAAKIKNAQNTNQLIVAKVQLEKAKIALQQAQANYNTIAWRGDVGMTSQSITLQQATLDYNSALANYEITASGFNDTALRTAKASLDNAQLAVEQAQRNLDKARVTAPFDSTVASVNFSVGDSAGTGNAVVVADLSHLQVRVTIAEVDMARLQVGADAEMTLDALPGKTFKGKLSAISPVGTITQGVVNYTAIVTVTDVDNAIKPGMTANLAIVVDTRENVLMVPTRAVRSQAGQRTVTASYKDQWIQVQIGTGLSNDQFIEVTSGLKEGDEVLLNQTQSTGGLRGLGSMGTGPIFMTAPAGRGP